MKYYHIIVLTVTTLLLVACGPSGRSIDDLLPKAVQDAWKAQYPDTEIQGIKRTREGSEFSRYELSGEQDSKEVSLVCDGDGKTIERITSATVTKDELPAAVKKAVGDRPIIRVKRFDVNGETRYKVYHKNEMVGKTRVVEWMVYGADGTTIEGGDLDIGSPE
jgi:hypothetical protein